MGIVFTEEHIPQDEHGKYQVSISTKVSLETYREYYLRNLGDRANCTTMVSRAGKESVSICEARKGVTECVSLYWSVVCSVVWC